MSSISTITNAVVSSLSRGITRASFGNFFVAGKHDAWGERYRVYDSGPALTNLVSDGIAAGTPIYKTVESALQNSPKPEKIVVGRLVTSFDHTFELTVQTSVTVGDVYSFNVRAPNGGAVTAISYTAQTGDTATLVAAALQALVNAISGLTATSSTPTIACTADNSDEMWQIEGLDPAQIWFEDTTVDSNLATELGQIAALYDDWYMMDLADCPSNARISATAGLIETLEKTYMATSFDTDNLDSGSTTSTAYTLNASAYNRTAVWCSNDQNHRLGAAIAGARLPYNPGSQTWTYKQAGSVAYDTWTATQESTAWGLNANTYTRWANLNGTYPGKMGSGEWIDVIRGRDWLVATIRENIATLMLSAAKVPFTDGGAAMIKKEVRAAQTQGVEYGFLAADPAPFVTVPLVADVSSTDKIARTLPDVYAEQTLAGAIIHVDPLTVALLV